MSLIKLYRKKPMAVEVMQFLYNSERLTELAQWMGPNMKTSGKARHLDAKGWLEVMTLEDGEGQRKVAHVATEGDYIIKGSFGEFWPVKQHIFDETYEEVN